MSSIARTIAGHAFLALLLSCIALALPAQAVTHPDEPAAGTTLQACARCHGEKGVSPFPLVPHLAAQRASYLKAETLDFKTHERSELLARSVMQGQVPQVDDATASSLAQFYAAQAPAPGVQGSPERMAKGRTLFFEGNDKVAACTTCHGQHAEGVGIYPRLAGQHAVYLQYQLRVKQHEVRRTSVMHGLVGDLTEDDMVNLATYLESVP